MHCTPQVQITSCRPNVLVNCEDGGRELAGDCGLWGAPPHTRGPDHTSSSSLVGGDPLPLYLTHPTLRPASYQQGSEKQMVSSPQSGWSPPPWDDERPGIPTSPGLRLFHGLVWKDACGAEARSCDHTAGAMRHAPASRADTHRCLTRCVLHGGPFPLGKEI